MSGKDKSKMLFSMLNKSKDTKPSAAAVPSTGPPVNGPSGPPAIREVSAPPTVVIVATAARRENDPDRKVYSSKELKSIRSNMENTGELEPLTEYYKVFAAVYADRVVHGNPKNAENAAKDKEANIRTDAPPGFGGRRESAGDKKSAVLDDVPGVVKVPTNLKPGSSSSSGDKWVKGETVPRKKKDTGAGGESQEKGRKDKEAKRAADLAEQIRVFEEERLRLQEERRSKQVDAPPGLPVRSSGTFHHETDDIMLEMQAESRKREESRKPPVPVAAPVAEVPLWGSVESDLAPSKELDADMLQSLTGALLDSLWTAPADGAAAPKPSTDAWLGGLTGPANSGQTSQNAGGSSRLFSWSNAEPSSISPPVAPPVTESLSMESLLLSATPPIQDTGLPGLAAMDLPSATSPATLPATAGVAAEPAMTSTGNEKVDAAKLRLLNQSKAFETRRQALQQRKKSAVEAPVGSSKSKPDTVVPVAVVPSVPVTAAAGSPSKQTKVSVSSLFSAAQGSQSVATPVSAPATAVSVGQVQQALVQPTRAASNRSTQNLLSKLGIQPSAAAGSAATSACTATTPTKQAGKEKSGVASPSTPTSSPFAFHTSAAAAGSSSPAISATGSTATASATTSSVKKLNRLQVLQRQTKVTSAVASANSGAGGNTAGAAGNVRRVNLQGLFNSAKPAAPSAV